MAAPDNDEGVDTNLDLNKDVEGSSEDENGDGADFGNDVKDDDLDDDDDDGEEDTATRDDKGRFAKKGGKDDEEEEEPEKEDEEEEEEEEEPRGKKGDKDKDGKKVPYGRLQAVIRERNQARAQNEQLMERLRASDPSTRREEREGNSQLKEIETKIKDVSAQLKTDLASVDKELEGLYEQVEELRSESKSKEAAAVQRKIDGLKDRRVELRQDAEATKTRLERQQDSINNRIESRREATVATEIAEYNRRVDVINTEVPQFNPEHEDYDPKAVKEFEFDVQSYEKNGMTPTQALTRAATLFLGYDPFSGKKQRASKDDDKGGKRGTDVRGNIRRSEQQPPRLRGRQSTERDVNIENMTEEQWSKLTEAQQRKYLGDNVG